jgi:hypothetical protein
MTSSYCLSERHSPLTADPLELIQPPAPRRGAVAHEPAETGRWSNYPAVIAGGRLMGFEAIAGGNLKPRLVAVIVALMGGIIAVVWFGFAPAPNRGGHCEMCADVRMLRSVIQTYNAEHPESPYDDSTPVGPGFWDPLVRNGYLDAPPENYLQRGSSVVVTWPRDGAGWVWADSIDPTWTDTAFYTLYGIDKDGSLHDHNLTPLAY